MKLLVKAIYYLFKFLFTIIKIIHLIIANLNKVLQPTGLFLFPF